MLIEVYRLKKELGEIGEFFSIIFSFKLVVPSSLFELTKFVFHFSLANVSFT